MQHVWETYPAGTLIVAAPGFATVYPDFDCETYSEGGYLYNPAEEKWGSLAGLSKQNRGLSAIGARNYVRHPSFRLLSWSWNLKDGRGPRWWRPPLLSDLSPATAHPKLCDIGELHQHIRNGGILEAFNVDFEWTVWTFYCVPVLGWRSLDLMQLRCCMAKGRVSAYPGALKDVGEVLQLHERKDPAGDKLIKKLTVPKNPTKADAALRWTPITASKDFEKFYEYNRQDIRTEAEASARIPDQSMHELETWRVHFQINARGMQIDTAGVENCIAIVEQCFAKHNAELQRITNYAVSNASEVAKTLEWMSRQGVTLFNLDEETLEEALLRTDYPTNVMRVLRIRQMLAFGSVKKLFAFRSHTTTEGRLHDQYVYYGAHTGLWNGRAVQPANLYKGIFSKPAEAERALSIISARCLELVEYEYPDTDPLEVVASCLRSLIIARPGHRLMSADFTAIQAVATSCMAGEQWRIDVFKTHGKIYEMMAAMLTGKTLEFYLDYKKQNGKHHQDRQDYGKIPVLSADFGAWVTGWKRFGADKLGDDQFIKNMILRTWATIPNIREFWGGQTRNKFNKAPNGTYAQEYPQLYGLEGAAVSAVLEPGRCFGYNGVSFQVYEDVLYCHPPSGGLIRYHKPRLTKSSRQYASPWEFELSYEGWNSNQVKAKAGWVRMFLYGGVLTQNVISHMCREVQALTLIRLENSGYPVVMHTHDENVTEIPWGIGSKEEYIKIVRVQAPFAYFSNGEPWPIRVPDAWEAQRYGKWED